MQHDISLTPPLNPASANRWIALVLAALFVLVAVMVSETPSATPAKPDLQTEDWHGNVKRSHWPG